MASDLPAIRWLTDQSENLIRVETDPAAYAATVVKWLEDPRPEAEVARRRAFAAEHSWQRRAEAFAELLGVVPASR
ncbi:glycosyltransferase involved in cell wall biosynthesis [Bradyrhizobium sp. GM22.5]